MPQHQIDHINARTCWETIALRCGETKAALIVETDLSHDAAAPGYDAEAFASLMEAVKSYALKQPHIDVVVFYKIGET
jgi:hypothetical protein